MNPPRFSNRYASLDEYLHLIFSMLDELESPEEIRRAIEAYVPPTDDPATRAEFRQFLDELYSAKFPEKQG